MRKLLAGLTIWFLAALPAPAQRDSMANPTLFALDRGVDDEGSRRPLDLSRLEVDVRLAGSLAETEVTAQFANPTQSAVEGRFSLQLPENSTVSGYALDVGGEMIDGVLVEQPKAREAYTDKVRRGVDPGLGEVSRAGVFSTRVFPIFPGSGRTIRVRFVTPLDPEMGYALPLGSQGAIGNARIRITADGAAAPPRLSGPGLDLVWSGDRAEARATSRRLQGALRIAPVRAAAPLLVSQHGSGERFFQLEDSLAASAARVRPERLRVYWDRSRSRRDHRLLDEVALLRRAIDELEPGAVDLVLFGSDRPQVVTVRNAREAEAALERVRYRGATSYEGLSRLTTASADLCLLFSDGLATVDRRDPLRPGCPLHAITTAPDADLAWLTGIAAASGGEAFRLGEDRGPVLARLTRRGPAVAEVVGDDGAPLSYAVLPGGANGVRLVGRAPATGGLRVRIGGAWSRYAAPGVELRHDGAGTLWAASQVALAAGDPAQLPVMKDLARRYGVAGPDMAFVVLETPYDYAQDNIEPPLSYPKRLRASYDRAFAERERSRTADQARWTEDLAQAWAEQKRWWNARYDPNAKPASDRNRGKGWTVGLQSGAIAPPPPPPPPVPVAEPMPGPPPPVSPPPVVRAPVAQSVATADSMAMPEEGEVVVTGSRIAERAAGRAAGASNVKAIEIAPPNLDRPYIRALEAADRDWERAFSAEERVHGATPAFYLDASDWLWRRGLKAQAVEVLLSALDLPTANNETIGIVASRLSTWDEHDRAVGLFARLHAFESFRPQPARTLALALARRAEGRSRDLARADYERALSLLEEVIETRPSSDYQGIEMVALMDANRILPRYARVGGTRRPLDPRLVALLDVDMRVLLEWSSGNNDLDLHVAQPDGETAYYGNLATRLGGRMSNDMTSGYGPEEYLLRRAAAGEYRVLSNSYAADTIDPNGVPRVTLRLIRDWGRPTEHEEVVDVEMRPDERGQKLIGRVVVPKAGARR